MMFEIDVARVLASKPASGKRWRRQTALWRSAASLALILAVMPPVAAAESRPTLSLPVACEPGRTCFIQNYVDLDPGAGVRDFACGAAAYNGHKGVDFRLLSAAAAAGDVPVLAAADGVVKATRDGVIDIFRKNANAEDIKGRECGNGVVIDHGGGWETQYCHLKRGSIRVAKDAQVKRGDTLGAVGYSGDADFAHLHLSVRQGERVVDPFLPDAVNGACDAGRRAAGMWSADVAAKLTYKPGEIIGWGFAGSAPDFAALETDHRGIEPPAQTSSALLLFGRFINLRAGDRVRIVINGPGGSFAEELSQPLDRNKATMVIYAGKKRSAAAWPAGRYDGRIELVRDGAVIAAEVAETTLAPSPASR